MQQITHSKNKILPEQQQIWIIYRLELANTAAISFRLDSTIITTFIQEYNHQLSWLTKYKQTSKLKGIAKNIYLHPSNIHHCKRKKIPATRTVTLEHTIPQWTLTTSESISLHC